MGSPILPEILNSLRGLIPSIPAHEEKLFDAGTTSHVTINVEARAKPEAEGSHRRVGEHQM